MFVTRHASLEAELVRWLVVIALALAMCLILASVVAAGEPMLEPQRLPDDMGAVAKPLPESVFPFYPEDAAGRVVPPAEAAARLWSILDHHRHQRCTEALLGWEQLRLPDETAHWREIAIGAAYLRAGNLEEARLHLEFVRNLWPRHPVAAYYLGLLRLEQADAAERVPDVPRTRNMLVAYRPLETRAFYESLAIKELHEALEQAQEIQLDQPLVATAPQLEESVVVPRASDLLAALGAGNYVGKAHHVLFGLHLGRRQLVTAEYHLDRAAETGLAVLYGYQDLATAWTEEGYHAAAVRAAAKDLQVNHPWLPALAKRFGELTRQAAPTIWVW